MIGWGTALRDGAMLALLASVFVMTTLRLNPRLFLRHFPVEIRDAIPPRSRRERAMGLLIGLPFLALLFGLPWWSTAAHAAASGEHGFWPLAVHGFVVSMVFNTVDWLLLDEFWLGRMRPRWALPAGAEDVAFRFDHAQHLRGFIVGTVLAAATGAGVAALVG